MLPNPKIHQYNLINNERFCTAAANVMRYILTGGRIPAERKVQQYWREREICNNIFGKIS